MVKLGLRLHCVAKLIGKTNSIADIGSDHALLPIYLLNSQQVEYAVAGELGDGPFLRAKEAINRAGLSNKVDVRQGDGLRILEDSEVDTVVIAGMGGDLMTNILCFSPKKTESFKRFILQPMKHDAVLRKWLSDNGFVILRESLIFENGKYYPAMEAVKGVADPLSDLEIHLGPCLLKDCSPMVSQWLSVMTEKYLRILDNIERSKNSEESLKRLWQQRCKDLNKLMEERK